MNLYEIRREMFDLLNPIDEHGDPIDIGAPEVHERIEKLEMNLETKAENSIAYMKNLRAECKMIDEEISRLKKMKESRENRINGLGEFLIDTIEKAGRFFNFGIHKARMQNNSQPSVVIYEERLIPDRFVEIETKVKKREILDWYKRTGEIPPGTDIVKGSHLRI